MVKNCLFLLAFTGCVWAGQPARGDTIQLKDNAAVVGKVLAEKRDQVAIDIGYTVLVIPRSQISKIGKTDEATASAPKTAVSRKAQPEPETKAAEGATFSEPKSGFYSGANK